jgi:hypothetical protein
VGARSGDLVGATRQVPAELSRVMGGDRSLARRAQNGDLTPEFRPILNFRFKQHYLVENFITAYGNRVQAQFVFTS